MPDAAPRSCRRAAGPGGAGRGGGRVRAAGRERLPDMYFPRGPTAFLKTSNTFLERAFFFSPPSFPPSLPRPSLPLSLGPLPPAGRGGWPLPLAAAGPLALDVPIFGAREGGEPSLPFLNRQHGPLRGCSWQGREKKKREKKEQQLGERGESRLLRAGQSSWVPALGTRLVCAQLRSKGQGGEAPMLGHSGGPAAPPGEAELQRRGAHGKLGQGNRLVRLLRLAPCACNASERSRQQRGSSNPENN